MEKHCFKCEKVKPRAEFYRHPAMGDGLLGKCKECTKADARMTRLKRLEYYRAYDRRRGNRQSYDYVQDYRQNNPEKYKAHSAVSNAVRTGRLVKPSECERCGDAGAIHGHHHDYSKPLDVEWLCAACHRQEHVRSDRPLTPTEPRI